MSRVHHLLFALTTIAACTTTDNSSGITQSEVVCPPSSTLTYANFGQAFVTEHCLACHASRERPTLASQAALTSNATLIIREAVTTTNMPEDESMGIEERRMLGEWLACGAP